MLGLQVTAATAAKLQYFIILELPSVYITHCSGCVGLKTRMHAASSWPRDSLPLILIT